MQKVTHPSVYSAQEFIDWNYWYMYIYQSALLLVCETRGPMGIGVRCRTNYQTDGLKIERPLYASLLVFSMY